MKKFNPVQTLTKRTFQQNKGRNIAAVTAVILTALMFTALFVLSQSISKTMVEMAFRQSGYDAQVSFKSITEAHAEKIAAHPDVKEAGDSIVLGIAENQRISGRQVEIRWANEGYASHSFSLPTVGRMPQAADEIAVDTIVLDRLGIAHKLGQKITLEWRKDLTGAEKTSSTFTLCGFWDANESAYASLAWVSREYADAMTGKEENAKGQILGLRQAQFSLYSDVGIEAAMDKILADTGLTGLEYSVNLAYSPEMRAGAAQESRPMYLGMILVFIAGYLIIFNIFQISVTADIQFYGKLKTLGTTAGQIRRLILGQADRLCILGIPAGMLLGYFLGAVLVPVLAGNFADSAAVSASPVIFIGAAFFTWLTVLLSCMRPAWLAGKVSPMEALRLSDALGDCKRKHKRRKDSASLSGMARANLGRNKKRTAIVICSLTFGLVLLSCFYAKNAAFDMEKYLAEQTIADFQLSDATDENYINGYDPQGDTLNAALTAQVERLPGLEALGHQYSHQLLWEMDEQTIQNLKDFYDADMLEYWASYDPYGVKALKEAESSGEACAVLFGLDGIPLDTITQQHYLLEGSYDAEKFASGDYIMAIGPAIDVSEKEAHKAMPAPSVSSTVTLEGRQYTVMAVVYPLSTVTQGAPEGGLDSGFQFSFILPASTFQKLYPQNTLRRLFFNVDDEHMDEAYAMLEDYAKNVNFGLPVTSRETMIAQYERETKASAVIGNAISIIIALVGVLNFINSMVTAIISRRKEFAMIQSVGMTKKQLCRMLVYEGLDYAALTLAASYIVSSLAVGIGVRALTANEFSTFHFTLLPLIVCTPVIVIFAVVIPFICFKNLEKQSIVERLRTE